MCKKCMGMCGILFLIFGVLFLLRDLGVWDFWMISWWTVGFLLLGVGALGCKSCPECQGKKK